MPTGGWVTTRFVAVLEQLDKLLTLLRCREQDKEEVSR